MIEKIVLAVAITFSLYSIVPLKPPQRAVAIDVEFSQANQAEVSTNTRIE